MSDRYPIVIVPLGEDDGGGYLAYVPDLYGCTSDGQTEEEAAANVRGAIVEWLDEAKELGQKIPAPGSYGKKVQEEWDTLVELVKAQDKLVAANEANKKKCKELEAQVSELRARLHALEPALRHRHYFFDEEEEAFPALVPPVSPVLAAKALAAFRRN